MKIMYDFQSFSMQKYGGISRYFNELQKGISSIKDNTVEIPILLSNNYYLSNNQHVKFINFLKNKNFRGKTTLFNMLNKPYSILKLKQQNYDIFHPTYYDPYFLQYLGNKPFVITVHDMIHEKFPDNFSRSDKTTQYKKLLCSKATKIIAISKNTKKDLIEILGIDESKIEVIYHGNSFSAAYNNSMKIDIPKKYILYVGTRNGYKNFNRFIKAVSKILIKNHDLNLVCAGGGAFSHKELTLLNELRIANKVLQYSIDDTTLAYLYKNALMFIFPSLYEGFGIPILEAFSCGCPVICSNTSSFPEIAKDAAIYFDPYCEASMYNAINKMLNDKRVREELINKGKKRVVFFSWDKAVYNTLNVYKYIV